jgi:pimeloyl-ACP methyl ester carboxylesterase
LLVEPQVIPIVLPTRNTTIVALHCSGSTGRQWQPLRTAIGSRFNVLAPDLLESGAALRWCGDGPFRLTDEARAIVDIIDAIEGPIHLVGHSYGGCVALRIAIERPHRVASLSLYEPTVFHVLSAMGEDGCRLLGEIRAWGLEIGRHVMSGAYRSAAKLFYEYWNGSGSFPLAKQEVQVHLTRYMFKVCLEFCAVLGEGTPLATYRGLRIPLLLICGEATSKPVVPIARKLAEVMKVRNFRVVSGAGHMGPISHPEIVAEAIAGHVLECDTHREAAIDNHATKTA